MKTRATKRLEANERQIQYDKLSTRAKLEKLDRAFGLGKGSLKQRAKLTKLLEEETVAKQAKQAKEAKSKRAGHVPSEAPKKKHLNNSSNHVSKKQENK